MQYTGNATTTKISIFVEIMWTVETPFQYTAIIFIYLYI